MSKRHFKEAIYAQYAVGSLGKEEVEALLAHLDSGCEICRAGVKWYMNLQATLQRDGVYEPPESSLESVRNAFRLRKPETVNLVSVTANMLFDSFLHPMAAGVRRSVLTERQVLYQAGEMQLDLKIERTNEEQEHVIIGQLIPQKSEALHKINSFQVLLREGEQIVQCTRSNEMGEFVFRVVPRRAYDLEILLTDSKKIFLAGVPSAGEGRGTEIS